LQILPDRHGLLLHGARREARHRRLQGCTARSTQPGCDRARCLEDVPDRGEPTNEGEPLFGAAPAAVTAVANADRRRAVFRRRPVCLSRGVHLLLIVRKRRGAASSELVLRHVSNIALLTQALSDGSRLAVASLPQNSIAERLAHPRRRRLGALPQRFDCHPVRI